MVGFGHDDGSGSVKDALALLLARARELEEADKLDTHEYAEISALIEEYEEVLGTAGSP